MISYLITKFKDWRDPSRKEPTQVFVDNPDGSPAFAPNRSFKEMLGETDLSRRNREAWSKYMDERNRVKSDKFFKGFNRIVDDYQDMARKLPVIPHEVINAIHLKAGDAIIHNYARFKIESCVCGFGAGNEFGNYLSIKGWHTDSMFGKKIIEFCAFQECPVIRLLEENQ